MFPEPNGLHVTLAGVSMLEGSQEFLQKQVPLGQLAWFQILAVDKRQQEVQAIVTFRQVSTVTLIRWI